MKKRYTQIEPRKNGKGRTAFMLVLLLIIYITFISLGLPDTLLGAAWPSMYMGLNMPLSAAGLISMIVSGGTILSSLLSDKLIRRFGTGAVTTVSVLMTAVALLLFSTAKSYAVLCVLALPLGLGAGSVDAGLNNFVALHYKARHMSWLHCFWGIGATVGPMIMAAMLAKYHDWTRGYLTIGLIQSCLVVALFLSLPLWKKALSGAEQTDARAAKALSFKELLALPGAKAGMGSFFVYCSIESTLMLWGASFLVSARNVDATTAANWISINFLGITFGRFLSGFLTMKFSQRQMVRMGQGAMAIGILCLILLRGGWLPLIGLFLIGLGCAPIFPSLLHETPLNFGASHSQQIMGIQMACAYVGTTCTPPLFGLLASALGYELTPWFLLLLCGLSIFLVERLNHLVDAGKKKAL